jgi:hypothetical protein
MYASALAEFGKWPELITFINQLKDEKAPSFKVSLLRIEAHWRMGETEKLFEAQKEASNLLTDPSPAELSLINWHNNLGGLHSRFELLQMTERRILEIRKLASEFEVSPPAEESVFVYWHSGLDKAPKIIQACVTQMRKVYGSQLVLLDKSNVNNFVTLPKTFDRVLKLWPANYSDALRVALLTKHGGLWLDATVYTTENSLNNNSKYRTSPLFTFTYGVPRIASWFMLGERGNYQSRMLYAAMVEYWQRNRKLKNYFLFHDFFEILFHLDPEFRRQSDLIPTLPAPPHNAAQNTLLFEEYDAKSFANMLSEIPIQKLTYKPEGKKHGPTTLFGHLSKSS